MKKLEEKAINQLLNFGALPSYMLVLLSQSDTLQNIISLDSSREQALLFGQKSGHVSSPLITIGHEPGTETRRIWQLSQVGACYRARLTLDWVLASLSHKYCKTTTLTLRMVLLGCARSSAGNGHCHKGGKLGSATVEGPAERQLCRSVATIIRMRKS